MSLNQSLTVSPVSCTSCTSYVSCQSCHQLGLGLTTPYLDNMQEPSAAGFVELAQDAMSCEELADMLNGVPGVERVRTRFEKTNEGTDRFLASLKSSVYSTPFEFEATRFLHSPEAGSATSNFALCFKHAASCARPRMTKQSQKVWNEFESGTTKCVQDTVSKNLTGLSQPCQQAVTARIKAWLNLHKNP